MTTVIRAEDLTSFDISPDGSTVRFNLSLCQGGSGALELPTQVVNFLLMNLPRVVEQALRRSRRDDDVRLVHGLNAFALERDEPEDGVPRHVLTLRTHGGYEIPFAMTGAELGAIAQAIIDQALADGAMLEPVTLDA